MNGRYSRIVRRGLLEQWAVLMAAIVVGFLGPFGTYGQAEFPVRVTSWWLLLIGAYILVRPTILLWRRVAEVTALPRESLVFWGVILSSLPIAWLWRAVAGGEVQRVLGFAGVVQFTLLCALLVMGIARWAAQADGHLRGYYDQHMARPSAPGPGGAPVPGNNAGLAVTLALERRARLYDRLNPGFAGVIVALESEDHYVRVHAAAHSELLFLRLRDAIAEMDGVAGEQTHRSWWVARDAVVQVVGNGRTREIVLTGGLRAPVARDSIERLRRTDFLPDG